MDKPKFNLEFFVVQKLIENEEQGMMYLAIAYFVCSSQFQECVRKEVVAEVKPAMKRYC